MPEKLIQLLCVLTLVSGAIVSGCMYASNAEAQTVYAYSQGQQGYKSCIERAKTGTAPLNEAQKYCNKAYLKKS